MIERPTVAQKMCRMILIFITGELHICKVEGQHDAKFCGIPWTCEASLGDLFIPFCQAHNAWESRDDFQLNHLLVIVHGQLDDLLEIGPIIDEKDLFRCADKVYSIS